MLVKIVIDLPGMVTPVERYINLLDNTGNVLKTTRRKLRSLKLKWQQATVDMTDAESIMHEFYRLLDAAGIEYTDGGPDIILEW